MALVNSKPNLLSQVMKDIIKNDFIELSNRIRKRIVAIGTESQYKAVHYGGALSMVEIISFIYSCYININKDDATNISRDRFILSKGHACLAQYAALIEMGLIEEKSLNFEENGSYFAGHPVINRENFIDFSTGSLGNGLAYAIGCCVANPSRNVACVIGDGELGEGSIWESFRIAKTLKLKNLLVFIDINNFQQTGSTESINGLIDYKVALTAFGWNVVMINGNSIDDFLKLKQKLSDTLPNVVLAKTLKGFGIKSIENTLDSHHTFIKNTVEIFQHRG